jgi:hypothetical protein
MSTCKTDQDYEDRNRRTDEATSLTTSIDRLRELASDDKSRAVRDAAKLNIDVRNGGTYNLHTGKVDFPVSQAESDIMHIIVAHTRATKDRI